VGQELIPYPVFAALSPVRLRPSRFKSNEGDLAFVRRSLALSWLLSKFFCSFPPLHLQKSSAIVGRHKEKKMVKVVQFLTGQSVSGYSQYSKGEIAGFPDAFADKMIRNGVCELYKDGIPRDADGHVVVAKSGLARAKELMGEVAEKLKG
jgi:hypothetical protein